MPKKYSARRRYTGRRRRSYKKKRTAGQKIARKMQNKSLSYVKKKYTTVFPVDLALGETAAEFTISHVGGINTNSPIGATHTMKDSNPDGMLGSDMALY